MHSWTALLLTRVLPFMIAGTIPGTLGDLQQLILLDLSSNQFSGTLDDFADETDSGENDIYSVLRYLNISSNALLGERSLWNCLYVTSRIPT